MTPTQVVTLFLPLNAIISGVFGAAIMNRAKRPWNWPPGWSTVVVCWLLSKSLWLGTLTAFWYTDKIGFLNDPDGWAWFYTFTLILFSACHDTAAVYYLSGRATLDDEDLPHDHHE